MNAEKSKLRHHDNSFFGDPILFQMASQFHAALLPEFAELGAYAASEEGDERARLVHRHLPKLHPYDNWGVRLEKIDVHPAYHSLLTRARNAGIIGSLYEEGGEEAHVRHQARTMRLFLLAGLETTHLQELCFSSAGLGVLHANSGLLGQWKTLLISRMHDPSEQPFPQKQGASLSFAVLEERLSVEEPSPAFPTAHAQPMYREGEGPEDVFRISGEKIAVMNPLADGFLVSAIIDGQDCIFLVPRILASGEINGITLRPVIETAQPYVAPHANLLLFRSAGWMIGKKGAGTAILSAMRDDLVFDHAVMTVGTIRAAMRSAVDCLRQNRELVSETNLYARALADAALDCAAASVLVLRVARALDRAKDNPQEAAFAAIMRPVASYWVERIACQVVDCVAASKGPTTVMEGDNIDRINRFFLRSRAMEKSAARLVLDCVEALKNHQEHFEAIVVELAADIGPIGGRTAEVLRVAAKMALNDPASAFVLVEQLAYTVASAGLHKLDVDVVSAAFVESRLGSQWRSSYGMVSPRYNAGFILETLYPTA